MITAQTLNVSFVAGCDFKPSRNDNPQIEIELSGQKSKMIKMSKLHSFGRYTITTRPPQVWDGSRKVLLTSRQFQVLSLLVRARGKVVTKRVFLEKVWDGRIVEEANLSQTVFLLRRALGHLPGGLPYIETVAGQGYRIPPAAFTENLSVSVGNNQTAPRTHSVKTKLEEAENFPLMIDSIEDYSIYMLDCSGRILTWNRGAMRTKGYSREEALGQHYSMLFVPEDIDAHVPERELAAAAKYGRCEGEGWRIRKNGERYWASYLLTAMRGPDKKLHGFAKVVRDLSEHKRLADASQRMDASIRRERDRLHAAAESSMDALCVCEAIRNEDNLIEDFVFTYLNSNVEKIVSIPREVMLGGRMCDLLPENRALGLFEAYKRVVETGEPFLDEFSVRTETIKSEWIRVRAVRLEDGVVIAASDISDRVALERRLGDMDR